LANTWVSTTGELDLAALERSDNVSAIPMTAIRGSTNRPSGRVRWKNQTTPGSTGLSST
jgi:hypothetical protein